MLSAAIYNKFYYGVLGFNIATSTCVTESSDLTTLPRLQCNIIFFFIYLQHAPLHFVTLHA